MKKSFRAWDKEQKSMWEVDVIDFLYGTVDVYRIEYNEQLKRDQKIRNYKMPFDRMIIQRCAGPLEDNDGNDLDWWEGDVFERTDTGIDIIIYEDGCFWMKGDKRKFRQPLYECIDWAETYTKVGNVIDWEKSKNE